MRYNFDEQIDRSNTNSAKYEVGRTLGMPEGHIPLWVADMDFACPPPVIDAMKARLDRRILGYSDLYDPAYFQAVVGWMKRRYDWEVAPEAIVFSAGVIKALYEAVLRHTQPGDGVLFFTPSYHPFYSAVVDGGRRAEYIAMRETETGYGIDWETLESKAREKHNTMLILCNPHNPVGRVWSEAELRRVGEICIENGVFIVSDEIHADFRRAGQRHIPIAKLFPEEKRIITCTAPSKTFNLAGNHHSNILFSDIEIARSWRGACGSPNPLSIEACRAAYTLCDAWVDDMNLYIEGNLRYIEERLARELPALRFRVPEGTYFAWIDYRALRLTEAAFAEKLREMGLFVMKGSDFVAHGDGYIRVNIACPRATVEEAVNRLVAHLG